MIKDTYVFSELQACSLIKTEAFLTEKKNSICPNRHSCDSFQLFNKSSIDYVIWKELTLQLICYEEN